MKWSLWCFNKNTLFCVLMNLQFHFQTLEFPVYFHEHSKLSKWHFHPPWVYCFHGQKPYRDYIRVWPLGPSSALYEKPHTTTQSTISSLFVDFGAKANQRGANNNMTGGQMPTSLDYCLFIFFFLSRLSIILASNSISHLTLSRVYLTSLSRSR